MLHAARTLPWTKAVDSILFSHLYFGGWSGLTVRSWMYHVFYVCIALAAAGLAMRGWGRARQHVMRTLVALYACLLAGATLQRGPDLPDEGRAYLDGLVSVCGDRGADGAGDRGTEAAFSGAGR